MLKYLTAVSLVFLSILSTCAQENIVDYEGNWEGLLPDASSLNLEITLEKLTTDSYQLKMANDKTSINEKITSSSMDRIQLSIDESIQLDLSLSDDKAEMTGFVKSGILMYHITLRKADKGTYTGSWNPFMIDHLESKSIFLNVENYEDGSFATYPFFGDQRFTGTWCANFTKEGDVVLFRDFKTGMNFKGILLKDKIQLEVLLGKRTIAVTNLTRSETDWEFGLTDDPKNQNTQKPAQLEDGWKTTDLQEMSIDQTPLEQMIDSLYEASSVNAHSVLIAKEGQLVFEAYFDGYHANIPHDQRSASKSIASAMMGIAIDDRIMESAQQGVYDCIPKAYQYTKDSLKHMIRIKDLLTMSSGIDAIDFGINRNSAASEDSYQNSNDWLKTVLEAPMVNDPGTHANYGSANPYLLGVCLDERLQQPLELYMDESLFAPLGINNYIIQTENTASTPYFGGGMYLTPRDMLKFGQLYLNKGNWKGTQIISESWVEESFEKYLHLENANDKNEYGYLWWHKTYTIESQEIESIEARGAGGQYIFVIPALETVVAITSGNYRNGSSQLPEKILETYVLPALMR